MLYYEIYNDKKLAVYGDKDKYYDKLLRNSFPTIVRKTNLDIFIHVLTRL
jgi:hypothetical protein